MNDIVINGSIIQPNSLTYARYDFTALQKNIIYLALSRIRQDMTREKLLNKDIFNDYIIDIPINTLAKSNNYSDIVDAAKDMMKKPVEYQYSKENKRYMVATVLVNTAVHEYGSNIVKLTISKMAIPYILYIGQGFTELQGTIALGLKSIYTKRLYEMCCRWKDRGGFMITLDEFKKMLGIEKKYKQLGQIRERILDFSQKELKEKSDIWFEYDLQKVSGSRSFNMISFKIHTNSVDLKKVSNKVGEESERMVQVYNFLNYVFPHMKNDKALRVTKELQDKGFLEAANLRFNALNKEFKTGTKGLKDIKALIYTVLRQDFLIDC